MAEDLFDNAKDLSDTAEDLFDNAKDLSDTAEDLFDSAKDLSDRQYVILDRHYVIFGRNKPTILIPKIPIIPPNLGSDKIIPLKMIL
jgi:hypothetical protein